MQLLYLTIGLTGLTMMFFGAKWLLRSKTVVNFPIKEGSKEFKIKKPGVYAVCVMGGGLIKGFGQYNFQLSHSNNQRQIKLKRPILKWRFRKNWVMGVESAQFKISDVGGYKIEITNLSNAATTNSVKKKEHKSRPNPPIRGNQILIKATVSLLKKIAGIFFLVLGVQGSFWGILLAINPTVLAQ